MLTRQMGEAQVTSKLARTEAQRNERVLCIWRTAILSMSFLQEWQEIRSMKWLGARSQRTQYVIVKNYYFYPVGNLIRT